MSQLEIAVAHDGVHAQCTFIDRTATQAGGVGDGFQTKVFGNLDLLNGQGTSDSERFTRAANAVVKGSLSAVRTLTGMMRNAAVQMDRLDGSIATSKAGATFAGGAPGLVKGAV